MSGPNTRFWTFRDVRYCFTTKPLFECPMTVVTYAVWNPLECETTLTKKRPEKGVEFTRHITDEQEEAARLLGVDGKKLIALIDNGHRSAWHPEDGIRWRIDGKLTNRCRSCGAKLIDHGYSAYVERDWDPEVDEDPEGTRKVSKGIADRLGFSPPAVRLKGVNGLKRSEARKWAYEQYTQARAAAKEAEARG